MAKVVTGKSSGVDQASAKDLQYANDKPVEKLSGEEAKKLELIQKGIDSRKKNQDLFNQASTMVAQKNPKRNESFGKSQNFSYTQTDLKRLKSFGSDVFGKVGFNPYEDNNTAFNAATDGWDDIGRAGTGFLKLAGIGAQDTFLEGSLSASDNYEDFGDIMRTYSSTREGKLGSASNALLSAGYTAGIIGGIAAEEGLLAIGTYLSGGLGGTAAFARSAKNLERGFLGISKAWRQTSQSNKYFRAFDHLTDVNTARGFWSKLGKGAFHALNPTANTIDFLRTADKLKDLNGLARLSLGVGAIVRDARKFTMSHGESKLEANMARQEFVNDEMKQWHKDNPEQSLSADALNDITSRGNNVYASTYKANFGLIYATNALAFDNMFTSEKALSRAFKLNKIGKAAFNVTARQPGYLGGKLVAFGGRGGRGAAEFWGQFALSGTSEGSQELGQDLISNTSKYYYGRTEQERQLRGSQWEALSDDFDRSYNNLFHATIENQGKPTGTETFLSGALIGGFMGPINTAQSLMFDFTQGGGSKTLYNAAFNRNQYKKDKDSQFKQIQAKAELLNAFIKNEHAFLQEIKKPVFAQKAIQDKILEAVQNGNTKELEDLKQEAFGLQLQTMFDNDLQDDFVKHLKGMAKDATPQELNQAFNRTDITEQNASEFRAKLVQKADRVNEHKDQYDKIQNEMINPITVSDLRPSDKDYRANLVRYHAFENLKKEMLVSNVNIQSIADRNKAMDEKLSKSLNLSTIERDSLLDSSSLGTNIEVLETQVEGSKGLDLKGTAKREYDKAVIKLAALKKYKESVDKIEKTEVGELNEIEQNNMFDAYVDVLASFDQTSGLSKEEQRAIANRTFDSVYDYINLTKEGKAFKKLANTLSDPMYAGNFIAEQEKVLNHILDNKTEHISNSLEAFQVRKESSKMMQMLAEKGVYFSLTELDDLMKKGIMPSKFYDIATQTEATDAQLKYAQGVVEGFYKNLTGKVITGGKDGLARKNSRSKADTRKSKDILKQYGLTLNQMIDLNEKEGDAFLNKLISNKDLSNTERELLKAVSTTKAKLIFTDNAEAPVMKVGDVVYVDIRYASSEFKDAQVSFENLVISAIVQEKIAGNIEDNATLKATATRMMEQTKALFLKTVPTANVEGLSMFNNVEEFIIEVLNNKSLQATLAQVKDEISSSRRSLWTNMMIMVKTSLSKESALNGTMLDRGINIASQALDIPGAIDVQIEDEKTKPKKERKLSTSTNAKSKTEVKRLKDLEKMARKLNKQFGTNVSIVTSTDVAKKIVGSLKNPMHQKFADILFEAVRGYGINDRVIELRKSFDSPALSQLLRDVYNKSESISELIENLKDLTAYQAGELGPVIDWLTRNADNLQDGITAVKDIFFQLDDANTAGFYDENTNTAYIVADNVNETTMLHEMFLHPFLVDAERNNVDLYGQLVANAISDDSVREYVIQVYGTEQELGTRQYHHELVARAFDIAAGRVINQKLNRNFLQKLKEFFQRMFKKLMGNQQVAFVDELDFLTTVDELATMIVKDRTQFEFWSDANIKADAVEIISDFIAPTNEPITAEEETEVERLEEERDEKLKAISDEIEGMTDEEIADSALDRISRRVDINEEYDAKIAALNTTETQTEEPSFEVIDNNSERRAELQNDIRNIDAMVNNIAGKLSSGTITKSREITSLNSERTKLLIERKKLQEELDSLPVPVSPTTSVVTDAPVDSSLEPIEYSEDDFNYNADGSLIYDQNVPYQQFPLTLQYAMADVFGKSHGNISESEMNVINRYIKDGHKDFIDAIVEYNQNTKAVTQSQKDNAARVEAERKERKDKPVKEMLSDDELMDHLLTKSGLTIDTSILTDSERSDLIKAFKERALDVPGIIHFIFEKKMLVELEAQQKLDDEAQARYEAEFMELLNAEEEFQRKKDRKKKRATSTSTNLDALTTGTLEFQEEDVKGNLKTVSVKIGKALGRFISIYHPKIFKQEAEAFAKSVRDFKREVTAEKKRISDNIKFSENEVLATKELVDLFFKLERKGMLVPVIATEINKKLLEVKNPYRIRIINKKGYKPIGTIYSIEHGTKAQLKGTVALPSVKKENKIILNTLINEDEDVLSTEEEPRTPEEIDFFSTEEGQKLIAAEFKYLEEYYNSKLFTIETGSYTGALEDLSETERIIYDRAVLEGLYEKEDVKKLNANLKVVLPIGTSGSGKSTWIKTLPTDEYVVISPDAMRVEFTGDMNDKSKDAEIYEEVKKRTITAIKNGKKVVIDSTNLQKERRRDFTNAIKKEFPELSLEYKLMPLDGELAKKRIKAQISKGEDRADVSDETIDRHVKLYNEMLKDILDEPLTKFIEAPNNKPGVDLFMEGLAEKANQDKIEQELNTLVNAFIKENVKEIPQKAYQTHPLHQEFVKKIKNGPMAISLAYAVGVYQYEMQEGSLFSDKQSKVVENIIKEKLAQGFYKNEYSKEDVLMKDGTRYKIMSATKDTVSVFNVETSNLENLDILNFLSNIKDVVAEEVPVDKESFETKPSNKKGKIIKDALQNVFSNFDTSVAADLFVEDSIIAILKTQCK